MTFLKKILKKLYEPISKRKDQSKALKSVSLPNKISSYNVIDLEINNTVKYDAK